MLTLSFNTMYIVFPLITIRLIGKSKFQREQLGSRDPRSDLTRARLHKNSLIKSPYVAITHPVYVKRLTPVKLSTHLSVKNQGLVKVGTQLLTCLKYRH